MVALVQAQNDSNDYKYPKVKIFAFEGFDRLYPKDFKKLAQKAKNV